MDNPEYLKIDDIKYKMNTDYRAVIRLQKILKDTTISEYERTLGAICLFFGEEGINHPEHYERLANGLLKFIQGRPNASTGKIRPEESKIDMDYEKDWGLITASMKSEYNIDINSEKMHWWTFFDYLNGLSSECMFNRVRSIRNKDLSEIKDEKERREMRKLKKIWALDNTDIEYTKEQMENIDKFYELTGIDKEWLNGK